MYNAIQGRKYHERRPFIRVNSVIKQDLQELKKQRGVKSLGDVIAYLITELHFKENRPTKTEDTITTTRKACFGKDYSMTSPLCAQCADNSLCSL